MHVFIRQYYNGHSIIDDKELDIDSAFTFLYSPYRLTFSYIYIK